MNTSATLHVKGQIDGENIRFLQLMFVLAHDGRLDGMAAALALSGRTAPQNVMEQRSLQMAESIVAIMGRVFPDVEFSLSLGDQSTPS